MKEDDTRWGGIGWGGETGGRFFRSTKKVRFDSVFLQKKSLNRTFLFAERKEPSPLFRPRVPSVVYCVGGKFAVFYCELDGIVRLHFVFEDQLG